MHRMFKNTISYEDIKSDIHWKFAIATKYYVDIIIFISNTLSIKEL